MFFMKSAANNNEKEFTINIDSNQIKVIKRNKKFYRALKEFCYHFLKQNKNLTNSEAKLIYYLIDLSNVYKYGYLLSNKKIAYELALSQRQTSRIIQKLINKGILKGTYKTTFEGAEYYTSRLLELTTDIYDLIIEYQQKNKTNELTRGLFYEDTTKARNLNEDYKQLLEFIIKDQIAKQMQKKRRIIYKKGFTKDELKTAFYRLRKYLQGEELEPIRY